MLLICLLLLVGVARAQQQTAPTSGGGPSGTNTLPDTNPWHELLQKMMSLVQSAATPSMKSHGIEPAPTRTQIQGQRKNQSLRQFSEPNSNRPWQSQGQLTEPPYNEPAINPDQYHTQGQQAEPNSGKIGQGMERLNQGTWQQTNRLQDQTVQTGQNQTQDLTMKMVNEQAGSDVQNQGMPQERGSYIDLAGKNQLQGQRRELEPPRRNREQSNIHMPSQPQQQRVQTITRAPPVTQPPIQDCFWEGRFYTPGSDIVRGQHDRWCYVTYCDSQGQIQFWDDYNCPANSMRPTSSHNTGRQEVNMGNPPQSGGAVPGCNYKGIFYEPGQEISNHNIGERCYGEYCNQDSKVVKWEDWCTARTMMDPLISAGPNPANQREPVSTQSPYQSAAPKRNNQGTDQTGRMQAQKPAGDSPGQGQASGMQTQSLTGVQHGHGRMQGLGPADGPPDQGQVGGMQGPSPVGGSQGQSSRPQVQSQGAPGGGRVRGPKQGCHHNNLHYQPNEDVIVGSIGDLCYGYYCEGDNVFVHWEDKCSPTQMNPIVPTAPPATGTGFYFK